MNDDDYWNKPLPSESSILTIEHLKEILYGIKTHTVVCNPNQYEFVKEVVEAEFHSVIVKKSEFVPDGQAFILRNDMLIMKDTLNNLFRTNLMDDIKLEEGL